MQRDSPAGLWHANEAMEAAAAAALQSALAEFGPAITNAYEAGVQVPTLPAKHHTEPHIRAAALFLKRVLVDLRSTWLLVIRGYSSPAASVAASLWEHALAAAVLSSDRERYNELVSAVAGDLPWSPKRMAQLGATSFDPDASREVVRDRSRNIYAAYKWLCKVKHPTLRVTLHDAGATATADGPFVVMSAPDLRPENLPVKRLILLIACGRTIEAIRVFARALGCDDAVAPYEGFRGRLAEADSALLTIGRARREALPFGLTAEEGQAL